MATVLVGAASRRYDCTLSPPTWDVGLTGVQRVRAGDVHLAGTTTGVESVVDQPAAYYDGAGTVDPAAVRLRLRLTDGRVFERRLGPRGACAVMLVVPGDGDLLKVTTEVLAADGTVLATYEGY